MTNWRRPRPGFGGENGDEAAARPIWPRRRRRPRARTRLGLERLEPRQLLAADPVISEFLARNDGGLEDGNGRSPDWIEIFNQGDAPIDLQGYHLTDDAQALDKWTFPTVTVSPGDYLVVFASGQESPDFVDGGGNLHTNFTLKRGGEYVALVGPDNSVLSQYGANGQDFPEQLANVSYGVAQGLTLVNAASEGTFLVPGGPNVDGVWTEPQFDAVANGFQVGTASLGFETRPNDRANFAGQFETALPETAHAVYARYQFDLVDASAIAKLNLSMKYDNGFVAYLNGTKVAEENAPASVAWFSAATSVSPRDSAAVEFVSFDVSEHTDALVDGKNVLAIHGLNSADDMSDMLLVTELTAGASDLQAATGTPARVGYLAVPTPGAPNVANDQVFSGFVADTKFSVDRGFYDSPQQVEITTETTGATIYYTTDGSEPGPENPAASVYAGPLTISSTTTLRAAAFKDQLLPTNTDTETYLFVADVVHQDFQTAIDAGFPETWGRVPAEYGLDEKVIGPDDLFGGKFAVQLADSFKALPTISIVTDLDNLFGREGILVNTQRSGLDWERPTSVELVNPDGSPGFQIDAGIRIQGDASRDYSNAKKLSFRLAFRGKYGDTKLVYPLFGEGATDQFDTIRLRANYNDGSVHTPRSTQQIRDEWMRRTLLDMGQPNAHGRFVHVYINGIYWGFYNLVERPDEAFAATYFGGEKENWDSITAGQAQSGTRDAWQLLGSESRKVATAEDAQASNAAYQRLLGNNPDGTDNPDLETLLDVDNYIDYLIANFYGGNGDWPGRNFYAARERGPESTGFKFFSWDAEKVLGHEEGATVTANRLGANSDVALFYANLRNNAEFQLRFADRVQKHFFNGGALYVDPDNPDWDPDFPEHNVPAARYNELAQEIELPLVAELARWGDTSRRSADNLPGGGNRLITPDDWAAFRDGLYADYFPRRSAIVLDQLRKANLYPSIDAPVLSQHGGVIAKSADLQLSAPEGTVYFTTDGSDPRVVGGAVSATAQPYVGPLRLAEDTTIKARVLQDGQWSALSEASFLIASELPLRITELNYNPYRANPVAGLGEADVDNDRFEFVELMNTGSQPIDLQGVQVVETDLQGNDQGIRFTFAAQTLGAGQRIVVARDREAFQSRYGNSVPLAAGKEADGADDGVYGGRLSNRGEQLTLLDPGGQVIQKFTYRTTGGKLSRANGAGSSLEIVDPAGSYGDATNWRASSEFGGSPGRAGQGDPTNTIVVNEVLANPVAPDEDQIELRNTSAQDVDVAHWYVSDTADNYFRSQIASSTVVPALGYQVLTESQLGFGLNGSRGGTLWLISADASGRPLRFEDQIQFGPSPQGISLGPWPAQVDAFVPLEETTFGQPNSGPKVGDVVISEIYYSPLDPDGEGGIRVKDFEFIEVTNTTDHAIDLTGWQLAGDVAYDFEEGTSLAAGQSAVIVGFATTNANKASVFQFTLGMSPDAMLLDRITDARNRRMRSGVIDDEHALIQLVRPGDPSRDEPDFVPTLVVDQVEYQAVSPWSGSPAGSGDSLTRVRPEDYGPLPSSWVGATPTPGTTQFFVRTPGDANDDGQFDLTDVTQALQSGKYLTGQPAGWADGDFNGDGRFDQRDVVAALQAGRYLQGPLAARADALSRLAANVQAAVQRLPIDQALAEMVHPTATKHRSDFQ